MKDSTKISNALHEIRDAANHLNVPNWVIHYAKFTLKTNDRKSIYEWIGERDFNVDITLKQ